VQKQELETIEADYGKRKLASMRHTAFSQWRKRLNLVNAEERVLLLQEQKIVARTWETWTTAA